MAVLHTKALILRHVPEREHDRVLTVLTPDHGQLRIRARGTKKSVSKLGGSLEPLTEVDLSLANGRHLDQVIGAVLLRRFTGLRQDAAVIVAAQWFLELVERVTKPGQAGAGLYDLVLAELEGMAHEGPQSPGRLWLGLCRRAWRLLDHEGFAPATDHCARCEKAFLSGDHTAYEPTRGFIHATEGSSDLTSVSMTALAVLQSGASTAADRADFRAVHAVLQDVLHRTIDRPLNSERVLQAVVRAAALSGTV